MRILFRTYNLAFQTPGGGERVMLELQRALRQRGHAVELFDPWKHDPTSFDLVHYFSVQESAHWKEFKARYPKIPLVVTPTLFFGRGWKPYLRSKKERLKTLLPFFSENFLSHAQCVDLFLPSTTYEAESLQKYFSVNQEKIRVVPNGVGAHFYGSDEVPFRKYSKINGSYVLHVGRFHPVKQQDLIIRAMADSKFDCVFIGAADASHPDYFQFCRDLANTLNPGRFHFFDGIDASNPLLASAYSGANLFAFPSKFETFGIAALEAAAAGCDLLLSKNIVSREIFAGFGSFLDPSSVSVWRTEIEQKMQSSLRGNPGMAEKIAHQYSWSGIAALVESDYEQKLRFSSVP